MRWYQRFFRRAITEKQLDTELRFHLEQQIADYISAGMKPEEARRRARLEFGGLDQVKEECRDVGSARFAEMLVQDVRYGLRQLRRNPGFGVAVVITLALGIGANSAVFSVINGLFLRSLPVPEPERLVAFSGTSTSFSWAEYVALRDQAKLFASLSASYVFAANLNSTHPPQHVYGGLVSGNFLTTLGIQPVLGRGFLPNEDQISSPKCVVLLSYRFWRSQFGGDPEILGKTIRLDNATYTVVGVMPSDVRSVDFGFAPDLWAPLATLPQLNPAEESQWHPFTNPDEQSFSLFGRLKPGVSRKVAEAEGNVICDRLREVAGEKEKRLIAFEAAGVLPGELGKMFLGISAVVMVVAGLVLLIACANIANLLLARGTTRRREIRIRVAIGASRGRLIQQLMVGNLILAFFGAAAGLLLAWAATRAVAAIELPLNTPFALSFAPDLRVLLVTTGIAILASLIFGLAPAARSTRLDVNAPLKDGNTTSTGFASGWTRNSLLTVQVAVSVVVLVAAALFLHSLWNGFSINLGFRPENLLIVKLDTTAQGYSGKRSALFFRQLEDRVSKLPGVRSASVVAPLPLGIFSSDRRFTVPGTTRTIKAHLHMVGPRYFETMGIPVLRGRDFRDVSPSSPTLAVISRTMAERLFPNQDSLGRRISRESGQQKRTYEVVGVAGDTKSKTIGETAMPCLFELAAQNEKDLEGFTSFGGVSLVIRTVGKPKAFIPVVRQEAERLDPDLPIYGVETMEEQVGKSLVLARVSAWFLGVFGLLALTLAAVGLYGLMSYAVASRTREIAIRMVLGASARRTLALLARQGLIIVGVGLLVGLAAGLAVGRIVSSLLYGVGSVDLMTFVIVPIVLAIVAGASTVLPVRRATRLDPTLALRYE